MTRYWHNGNIAVTNPGGSWAEHIARGSQGGEDFPVPVGTPLYAPDTGWLRFRTSPLSEGGGQALTIVRDDGAVLEVFHASSGAGVTLNGPARRVQTNERAGASGGARGTPSQGLSSGPHAHEHGKVNGRRVPLSSIPTLQPAGGGASGFIPEGDSIMRNIRNSAGVISTIGEMSVELVAAHAWPAVRATWGDFVQLADDEYNGQVAFALRRRAEFLTALGQTVLADDLIDEFAEKISTAVAIDLDEDQAAILARLDALDEAVRAVDASTVDEADIAALRDGLAALPREIREELARGLVSAAE